MKTLCFTLLLLTSQAAQADRYVRTWTDYTDTTGFTLERTYNSQSLVNGSFGFGWCSELETTLEPTRDGRLKLRNCKSQKETVFTTRLNVRSPAFSSRDGASYEALDNASERIERTNQGFTLYKNGNVAKRFDGAGRLLEWKSEDGITNWVKRNVSGDPVSWETSRGFRLSLRALPGTGRIRSIQLPGGSTIFYQYHEQNLILVTHSTGSEWAYQYDDLHNLVRCESSDGFFENVKYDKHRDQMLSFQRGLAKRNSL